ncbi:MAG: hypothetical protein ACXWP4_17645 [Polyangiales bacterium]
MTAQRMQKVRQLLDVHFAHHAALGVLECEAGDESENERAHDRAV